MEFRDPFPIPKIIREAILDAHPGARGDRFYECMLVYLYYPQWPDKETEEAVLCRDVVGRLSGQGKKNNFAAIDYIMDFQRSVMPDLVVGNYNRAKGKCRYVEFAPFDPDVLDMITNVCPREVKEWVYAGTGLQHYPAKVKEERKRLMEEAEASEENCFTGVQKDISLYMNHLHVQAFSRAAKRYLGPAFECARYMHKTGRLTDAGLNAATQTLYVIENQPKPFYRCSHRLKSVRLGPLGRSLLTLKSELRKIITQEWVDLDLASAQFAINAKLWDIPELLDFLQSGKHLWTELFDWLGYDYQELKESDPLLTSTVKGALKQATYSSFFGMKKKAVMSRLTSALYPAIEKKGKEVLRYPLFEVIFDARDEMMKRINRHKGAEDCFGNFLKIEPNQDEKSILAQMAQAMEMKLLEPAVELARKQSNRFKIMLWQHDGFTVNIIDHTRRKRWVSEIRKVVDRQATKLGIPTFLEAEYLDQTEGQLLQRSMESMAEVS